MASPTATCSNAESYAAGDLGGHGDDFQRNIALLLLERATLAEYKFKLAFEMQIAGKFDDVVMYKADGDQWWLIQAKHKMDLKDKLTLAKLLPADGSQKGDFTLFKYLESYLSVVERWPYEGSQRFHLFTNVGIDDSIAHEAVDVDEILRFPGASHIRLLLNAEMIEKVIKCINHDFHQLQRAIIALFSGDGVDQTLEKHKSFLQTILVRSGNIVRFSNEFTPDHESVRVRELYTVLSAKINISTGTVSEVTDSAKIWDGRSRSKVCPSFVDATTVRRFFADLILSIRQPGSIELSRIINKDLRLWMKSWIRPDDFGSLPESVFLGPMNQLREELKHWEAVKGNRGFMTFITGDILLRKVQNNLQMWIRSRRSWTGLDEVETYYINRRIEYSRQDGRSGVSEINEVTDREFVELLTKDLGDQQCMILTAEPGMGKSILWQYLAFQTQQKYLETSVFLIYLNNLSDKLESIEIAALSDVLGVFAGALSSENISIIEYAANATAASEENKIIIYLDAFDEISPYYTQKVFQVIEILRSIAGLRLLISARIHVERKLEYQLHVKSMRLVPFDKSDQVQFLRKFWKRSQENHFKFETYSAHLLDKFHNDIYRRNYEFTGVPLIIRMMAVVFLDSFEVFLKSDSETFQIFEENETLNIVSLYEKFVNNCLKLKLSKKFNTNFVSPRVYFGCEPMFNEFETNYQLIAVNKLIRAVLRKHITDRSDEEKLQTFLRQLSEGTDKSFLVEIIDGSPQFTHLSFGEYFVAKYLYKYLGVHTKHTAYKQIISILQEQTVVRRFLLVMLDLKRNSTHMKFLLFLKSTVVFWACEANCCNIVRCLQPSYNYRQLRSDSERSMLHVSAMNGSYEVSKFLVESNAVDVNQVDRKGITALHLATAGVTAGSKCTVLHEWRTTPFHNGGFTSIVRLLLSNHAKVDSRTIYKETALHYAAQHGHLEIARILTTSSASLNYPGLCEWTPLHMAAFNGWIDVTRLLLHCGAFVDACTLSRETPLHLAATRGHTGIVRLLIESSASVDCRDSSEYTPLHWATINGRISVVELLTASNANVRALTLQHRTPLHFAAAIGCVDLVQTFICEKALVNCSDCNGWTPLHYAVQISHLATIRQLIACNADVNAATFCHTTDLSFVKSLALHPVSRGTGKRWFPLHYATLTCNLDVIKLLVANNAIVDSVNEDQETALHLAAEVGNIDVVRYFISVGANVNRAGRKGWSPLHFAAYNGHVDMVNVLIASNAHVNCVTVENEAPLHLAAKNKNTEIVSILERVSKSIN